MRDDQEQRRPAPHRPPDPETVWLDIDTARGVDAAGNEILPVTRSCQCWGDDAPSTRPCQTC